MSGQSEDRLRALMAEAHRHDAPPPALADTMARRRRVRPPFAALALLAATAGVVLLWNRPRPPPAVLAPEQLRIEWNDPLAFLLEPPGTAVLRSVPRFDTQGVLP